VNMFLFVPIRSRNHFKRLIKARSRSFEGLERHLPLKDKTNMKVFLSIDWNLLTCRPMQPKLTIRKARRSLSSAVNSFLLSLHWKGGNVTVKINIFWMFGRNSLHFAYHKIYIVIYILILSRRWNEPIGNHIKGNTFLVSFSFCPSSAADTITCLFS